MSTGARLAFCGKEQAETFAAQHLRTMANVVGDDNHAKVGVTAVGVGVLVLEALPPGLELSVVFWDFLGGSFFSFGEAHVDGGDR